MKTPMKELYDRYAIDGDLSEKILHQINDRAPEDAHQEGSARHEFPMIDGRHIIDGTGEITLAIPYDTAAENIRRIDSHIDLSAVSALHPDGTIDMSRAALEHLGLQLMPYVAYGVLNGGSATSYIDTKKNSAFYPPLFSLIEKEFDLLTPLCTGRAKGLTPAYINPDGTPGYSFLELKMRSLLLSGIRASEAAGRDCTIPMFQMTSGYTHEQLLQAYTEYRHAPILKELIDHSGFDITEVATAKQPLIAAFTPRQPDGRRDIFTHAFGEPDHLLALPGGHGQNFYVLQDIYRDLYESGKRFVYLINVDNIGNPPSPLHIAITALTGCDGSFEFAYKTPIDTKGGVLVAHEDASLTCKDIGVAIDPGEISEAEDQGIPILFNCATGLFSLSYLTTERDHIIEQLPLRVSEQNKDAGIYAQAEQVTWEIIDLMDHPTIIAVNKEERFLAAKLLSESIMATQASHIVEDLLEQHPEYQDFCDVSRTLESGFYRIMREDYAMDLQGGRWEPVPLERILSDLQS
jgi:UTP--glucose-1-phosphate uridylyltransferase